jgi:hypothetical protein
VLGPLKANVPIPERVACPVSPAKIPVPLVKTRFSVNVVANVMGFTVPLPVMVPVKVPPAKVSTNVPFETRKSVESVRLVVHADEKVNAPSVVSAPVPVEVPLKMFGRGVNPRKLAALIVPDIGMVSACNAPGSMRKRKPRLIACAYFVVFMVYSRTDIPVSTGNCLAK